MKFKFFSFLQVMIVLIIMAGVVYMTSNKLEYIKDKYSIDVY